MVLRLSEGLGGARIAATEAGTHEMATKVLRRSMHKTIGSQMALSRRLGVAALAALPSAQ